eukprot:Clim_evm35s191 gene=Clim_evmTU35s191
MVDAVTVISYICLPLISGIVGYLTNVVGIRLCFYPIKFFGIGKPFGVAPFDNCGFGWQGIVPYKAVFMANIATDTMLELINPKDIIQRLDAEQVAVHLAPRGDYLLKKAMDEVISKRLPAVWAALNEKDKQNIFEDLRQDVPDLIQKVMDEIRNDPLSFYDLRDMVVEIFSAKPGLLVDMFERLGYKELRFLERSGFWVGGALGIVFTVFYLVVLSFLADYPDAKYWWFPITGFAIGYLTNYIALKVIFLPIHPRNICGYPLQGLFIKRQPEVSYQYSLVVCEEVMTAERMLKAITLGPHRDRLHKLIFRELGKTMDALPANDIMRRTIGDEEYEKSKKEMMDLVIADLPNGIPLIKDYADKALALQPTIHKALADLPPERYERVLHPVFEQDEWKLILIGGVLGAFVGVAQIYMA